MERPTVEHDFFALERAANLPRSSIRGLLSHSRSFDRLAIFLLPDSFSFFFFLAGDFRVSERDPEDEPCHGPIGYGEPSPPAATATATAAACSRPRSIAINVDASAFFPFLVK